MIQSGRDSHDDDVNIWFLLAQCTTNVKLTLRLSRSIKVTDSSPHVDKGDEFGREAPLLRVAELRRVAPHHLSQLIKHAVPLRVREPSGGQLVLKQTEHRWKRRYRDGQFMENKSSKLDPPVWFPNSKHRSERRSLASTHLGQFFQAEN